ncbi:MAG TPA: DUF479 domain-containing protein, partial [Flavobacteriia bacterium]|nr:DUF479 domain-containing protein [Flavobacteriia bacterium]
HFLAKNWKDFSKVSLLDYEANFIQLLEANQEILPQKALQILPYLKKQKWLSSYANLNGISKTLQGVNNLTKGVSKMDRAIEDLTENYAVFETDFFAFFKELSDYVNSLKKYYI